MVAVVLVCRGGDGDDGGSVVVSGEDGGSGGEGVVRVAVYHGRGEEDESGGVMARLGWPEGLGGRSGGGADFEMAAENPKEEGDMFVCVV
ncbi:hypothetical protein Tco_1302049 [Tanacetum coccineum]